MALEDNLLEDNLEYWKHSLENREPIMDENYYNLGDIIITDGKFIENVKNLRELILCYCVCKNTLNSNQLDSILENILEGILYILTSVDNIQYTEFVAFWKVMGMSYSIFQEANDKKKILKELLDKYCEERYKLYDKMGYSNVTVQALYDAGSSRKLSNLGIEKIVKLLKGLLNNNLSKAEDIKDFPNNFPNNDYVYFLPDENKELFEKFCEKLGLSYEFGQNHQGKIPDIVVKIKTHYFIIEAKHIKEKGGAQDKQVNELIDFISYTEKKDNIHYVAFMDGLYFNYFADNNISDEKIKEQKESIEKALGENKANFFVNTAGLEKLFQDAKMP